jgi:hypothetical protein
MYGQYLYIYLHGIIRIFIMQMGKDTPSFHLTPGGRGGGRAKNNFSGRPSSDKLPFSLSTFI